MEELYISMTSSQKVAGTHLWSNHLASLLFAEKENTPWRTVGHLGNRVLERTSGFELVLEDYDLGSRALFSEVSNPG